MEHGEFIEVQTQLQDHFDGRYVKLDDCKKTAYAYMSMQKHQKSYNKALLDFSEKLLKEKSFAFKTEDAFYRIAWTQMVPESYNSNVLKNFLVYAQKFNLENSVNCCKHLEELAEQRQQEKEKRKTNEK